MKWSVCLYITVLLITIQMIQIKKKWKSSFNCRYEFVTTLTIILTSSAKEGPSPCILAVGNKRLTWVQSVCDVVTMVTVVSLVWYGLCGVGDVVWVAWCSTVVNVGVAGLVCGGWYCVVCLLWCAWLRL